MQCANEGCLREAEKVCSECNRQFCSLHIRRCSLCHALVCRACCFDHNASNPLHEEGTPNA
jgi:hypothetical protein